MRRLLALAAPLALLAACASPSAPTATDSAAAPRATAAGALTAGGQDAARTPSGARIARVTDVVDLTAATGLAVPRLQVRSESSWAAPRLHVEWPSGTGSAALDERLAAQARRRVVDYRADHPGPYGVARPDLTGTWGVVANGPQVVGIRTVVVEFAGASTGESSSTLYGRQDDGTVWAAVDLVAPDARDRLVDLAVQAAVGAGMRAADADRPLPEDLLADLSFDRDGSLVLVAEKAALASADNGVVRLVLPRAVADPLLSDTGRVVRDAVAASPAGPAGAPGASPNATDPAPTGTDSPATTAAQGSSTTDGPPSTTATTTATTAAEATPGPSTATARPAVDCAMARCVALTFDDGPGPYTGQVLDALAARGARATFFVLGSKVVADPAVVRRAHDLGMAIGDHSWSHRDLSRLPADAVVSELERTADAVRAATGEAPVAARPPYGAFTRQTPHAGLPFVLWDVDTEDWKNRSVAETTRRAVAGAHRGAIVLLHDIHPSTARAVPGIVEALQAKGYTLVTVPELLGRTDPARAYHSGR